MKIFNLVNYNQSDIKYNIQHFPDGQQNVVIDINSYKATISYPKYELEKTIQIKSRLNSWLDLELIVCAVASLRELGVEEIHLYTPYIVGARSDRKFEEGGDNYLRDVICPVINSLNFKTVTCIDPHSDVLEACIKGFRKESNEKLIKTALNVFGGDEGYKSNNFILVSPDAGASKKIYKLAEQIGYKGDIITCSKDRDKDGKLTKIILPNINTPTLSGKDIVVIDDICDGGATFINIMAAINERYGHAINKKYLIITHGIFSKGFEELSKYFDGIYCTNSYKTIDTINNVPIEFKFQQLNVF